MVAARQLVYRLGAFQPKWFGTLVWDSALECAKHLPARGSARSGRLPRPPSSGSHPRTGFLLTFQAPWM